MCCKDTKRLSTNSHFQYETPTAIPNIIWLVIENFRDRKLEFIKALLFCSFHGTKAPTAFYCFRFTCGRTYHRQEHWDF